MKRIALLAVLALAVAAVPAQASHIFFGNTTGNGVDLNGGTITSGPAVTLSTDLLEGCCGPEGGFNLLWNLSGPTADSGAFGGSTGTTQTWNMNLADGNYALTLNIDVSFPDYCLGSSGAVCTNPSGDDSHTYNFTVASAPEPGSMLLLGTGLVGVARRIRRKK